jgi:hypothetical protein
MSATNDINPPLPVDDKAVELSRHTGTDSCRAILPDTLRADANSLPADLCRYPADRDVTP